MPAIQSSYGAYHAAALEGMVADSRPATITSRIVETAAGIGFGKVAVQGAADNGILVSAASKAFRGITVFDPDVAPANPDAYARYDTAAVMTTGAIWVTASVTVAAGDPAYYVPATGVFTNVATSNTAIPNGIFETAAAGGALSRLAFGFN